MKKVILLLVIIFTNQVGYSHLDTIRLVRKNFTSVFDKNNKYPYMVEWWLTKEMVSCGQPLKRKDKFKPDPSIPNESDIEKDYVGSGFDRGHMMPAADNLCETQAEQDECFYFSNISAQYHSLNAGDWKSLETFSREKSKSLDSLHIWAGNIGVQKKIGNVSVPKVCWKVIHIKKTNEWIAFKFDNINTKQDGMENNKVTVQEIEKLTGLKFK